MRCKAVICKKFIFYFRIMISKSEIEEYTQKIHGIMKI